MASPKHKNSCPGGHEGHEIYNFGRPHLGHYYYILSLSDLCLGVEKKVFKVINQHFTIIFLVFFNQQWETTLIINTQSEKFINVNVFISL